MPAHAPLLHLLADLACASQVPEVVSLFSCLCVLVVVFLHFFYTTTWTSEILYVLALKIVILDSAP